MGAREALIAYGYRRSEDGRYRRPGKVTQVWHELGAEGWLRFDLDGKGNEIPEVYTVAPEYQGTSGLSKLRHPEAFIWVWPDEEVERIYAHAVEAAAVQAAEAALRKGTEPQTPIAAEAGPTAEELASMQNAQAEQAAAKIAQEQTDKKRRWWR